MSIDVAHYRMSIGTFHGQQGITLWSSDLLFWKTIAPFFLITWMIYQMNLSRSGDVESNPGPILDPISLMCSITSLDIFGISETWLDNSIPDDQILLPGFLPPIRKDRRRDGAGVTVYTSETVAAKRCPLIEPTSGE